MRVARGFSSLHLISLLILVPALALADTPSSEPAADPNSEIKNGFTPLHFAAMRGDAEAVAKLLDSGVDANARQVEFQGTPLQYAAAEGHIEVVRRLLKHEATVDAVDANGRTPLMWAAMKDRAEVAKILLDADANIGTANDGGWTPLHYAMSYNQKATIKLLLERGASLDLLNKQGKTPLDVQGTNVKPAEEEKKP